MKFTKTICIPIEIEVEGEYVILSRVGEFAGMGAYCPAGEWKIRKLCGADKEYAEHKMKELKQSEKMWFDYKVELLSYEELSHYKKYER